MRYAFSNKTDECIFTIKVCRSDNILLFEISDNGEGDELENYRTEKDDDGINVLENRIRTVFELAGYKGNIVTGLEIIPSKEFGTTIKFKYPYEEAKSIYS